MNLVELTIQAIGDDDAIVHTAEFPSRRAHLGPVDSRLDPKIQKVLAKNGISDLYSHQSEAISHALDGADVMISTGTNSGKSLCYVLPILQSHFTEPSSKALLLYPTKALAQDQILKWGQWASPNELLSATYDGDTPKNQRSAIRKLAHVVATNPDMIHVGILPGHENWIKFLKSLRFIVIDEAHVYRGVFGSHVAWILRRLLRLCNFYGSRPQIIACSATVRNPEEHFLNLTGRTAKVVDDDGSPRGSRSFFFVNPSPDEHGKEPSRNALTAGTLARLASESVRTMAFSRSRVGVELVLKYARDYLGSRNAYPEIGLESYRAGYTAAERREIEKRLFQGELLGLSSTNAMELGVDIGGLDAVILNGFPGTVASFWQQAGRAGRGTDDSAIIFVASEDPLDQYLASNPDSLLGAQSERVHIDAANRSISSAQLKCMAHEKPISPSELAPMGPHAIETAEALDAAGELEYRSGRFYYPSHEAPASKVDIRGSGGGQIELRVGSNSLGAMEYWRALQYAHAGAIYLHRGATFRVESLDLSAGVASLAPDEPDHFTQAIVQSVVEPLAIIAEFKGSTLDAQLASLRVTTSVIGYRTRSIEGDEILSVHDLDLPPNVMETIGIRWNLRDLLDEDPEREIGAIHGVEHALSAVAPLFAGCDRGDLGSSWYAAMLDTLLPAVFVFDGFPGGIGLCQSIWHRLEEHWNAARALLESCSCVDGCPRCIFSPRCEIANSSLNKSGAKDLLLE